MKHTKLIVGLLTVATAIGSTFVGLQNDTAQEPSNAADITFDGDMIVNLTGVLHNRMRDPNGELGFFDNYRETKRLEKLGFNDSLISNFKSCATTTIVNHVDVSSRLKGVGSDIDKEFTAEGKDPNKTLGHFDKLIIAGKAGTCSGMKLNS